MIKRLVLVLGVVAFLALQACGGDDGGNNGGNDTVGGDDTAAGDDTTATPGGALGMCENNDGSGCFEYVGAAYTEENAAAACADADQTFAWGADCPTDDAVGACSLAAVSEDFRVVSYYYADAAAAQAGCEAAGGQWIAL